MGSPTTVHLGQSVPNLCDPQDGICHRTLLGAAFAQCSRLVDPGAYVAACVQDLCRCPSCPCATFAEYSRQCAHAGGQPQNWRSPDFCRECPTGSWARAHGGQPRVPGEGPRAENTSVWQGTRQVQPPRANSERVGRGAVWRMQGLGAGAQRVGLARAQRAKHPRTQEALGNAPLLTQGTAGPGRAVHASETKASQAQLWLSLGGTWEVAHRRWE